MGRAQGFQGDGNGVAIASPPVQPANPAIIRVDQLDITGVPWRGRSSDGPGFATGVRKKRITVTYALPDPIGTYKGLWAFLAAPDSAGLNYVSDGSIPDDGTMANEGNIYLRDLGFMPYNPAYPATQFTFEVDAPQVNERWRIFVVGVSELIRPEVTSDSPSKQFVCRAPTSPFTGREVAPLVSEVQLIPAADLGWATNPRQVQLESGDQAFQVAVKWDWPIGDQNFGVLGGGNIVLTDGTLQTLEGAVSKSAPPKWISREIPLQPGTTDYTVYVESFDVASNRNSQVAGITPATTFSVTRQLGATGQERAALVTGGSLSATPVTDTADGTAFLRVIAAWTAPTDPQFGSVGVYVKRPGGSPQFLFGGRTSPIERDIPNPFDVQTWRFYLVSLDVNNRANTVKDNGDGTHDTGETPWFDINVGNPDGQLNLAKARTDTFSTQLEISSGALRIREIDADVMRTGRLQIGGPGMVSQLKLFDTLGSLYGYWGDDPAYNGLWSKTARFGGSSPTASAADQIRIAGGVVSIGANISIVNATNASFVPSGGIVGQIPPGKIDPGYLASALAGLIANSQLDTGIDLVKLANGTLPVGVNYIGTVVAANILAGTVSVALTFTSPTLVISSGTVTVNIDATNFIKLTDTSVDATVRIATGGVVISSISNPTVNTALVNGSLNYQNSAGFPIMSLTNAPRLTLYASGAVPKVSLGILSSNGYIEINGVKVLGPQQADIGAPSFSSLADAQTYCAALRTFLRTLGPMA